MKQSKATAPRHGPKPLAQCMHPLLWACIDETLSAPAEQGCIVYAYACVCVCYVHIYACVCVCYVCVLQAAAKMQAKVRGRKGVKEKEERERAVETLQRQAKKRKRAHHDDGGRVARKVTVGHAPTLGARSSASSEHVEVSE